MVSRKISCHVVEDLLPLYLEKQTNEETTELIENHLASCDRCRQISRDISKNIFSEVFADDKSDHEMLEGEKKYLIKLRRTLLILFILILAVILVFTTSSYFLGRNTGQYAERFKQAEENDLFIKIDEAKEYNNKKIVLDKVLLDSTLTSILLDSQFDLSKFDSITLKDDLENYYRKAFTFPGNPIVELKSEGNQYILDFDPIRPETEKLFLEFVQYQGEKENSVNFDITLKAENLPFFSAPEYSNILDTDLDSGIKLQLDQLKSGISNTETLLTFDYEDTAYDAVNFGWYNQDHVQNMETVLLKSADSEPLSVFALQDITLESMTPAEIEKIPPKPRYQTFKVITEPIPKDDQELTLKIKNLYAVYYLDNAELTLDFCHKDTAELNYVYSTDQVQIDLHSAVKRDGRIQLYYEVKTKQGELLPEYVLDGRIKKIDAKYDVPLQGKPLSAEGRKYLEFPDLASSRYTLYLGRAGYKIDSTGLTIELP